MAAVIHGPSHGPSHAASGQLGSNVDQRDLNGIDLGSTSLVVHGGVLALALKDFWVFWPSEDSVGTPSCLGRLLAVVGSRSPGRLPTLVGVGAFSKRAFEYAYREDADSRKCICRRAARSCILGPALGTALAYLVSRAYY